ncbi:Wzz/FepE/Etk N-terminal domain-containing protein [Luteococcus sp. H138]|uniref:YveK family protein n=1 Tax=unclassified Luteococcus TaxID=2639923 RepID=UPI00313DDF10
MDVQGYLRAIRRRLSVVIACTLVGGLLGLVQVLRTPISYSSTVTLYVSAAKANSAGDLNEGAAYVQNQMASYQELVSSPVVLEPVIDTLHLDADAASVAANVNATAAAETAILEIVVSQPTADEAMALATAVGNQTAKTLAEVTPRTDQNEPTVHARVVSPASAAQAPGALPRVVPVALGLAAGLVLGCLAALLMHALSPAPVMARKAQLED